MYISNHDILLVGVPRNNTTLIENLFILKISSTILMLIEVNVQLHNIYLATVFVNFFRFFNQSTLRMHRGCITNHGKATGYRESRSVKGRQTVYPFIHPTENPLWHNAMPFEDTKPCTTVSNLLRIHCCM